MCEHSVAGTEGRDTLIRLQSSLRNILLVGVFEFVVAAAGAVAVRVVLDRIDARRVHPGHFAGVVPGHGPAAHPPPVPAVHAAGVAGLALLGVVLSTLDFLYATRASAAETEKLLAHVGDNTWWCTHGDDV